MTDYKLKRMSSLSAEERDIYYNQFIRLRNRISINNTANKDFCRSQEIEDILELFTFMANRILCIARHSNDFWLVKVGSKL